MPWKHQQKCYRNIKGVRYMNFADLYLSDEENEELIKEAKSQYNKIKKVKHFEGYYQLFVADPKNN